MSKPISFGFGKAKGSSNTPSTSSKTSISLVNKNATVSKPSLKKAAALHDDEDDFHDEEEPRHEALTGFSSAGAILSKPTEERKLPVIENAGNLDWRRKARGKNILPQEVQNAQNGQAAVLVEKDETSKASGLQLSEKSAVKEPIDVSDAAQRKTVIEPPKSADEEALQALLTDDSNAPKGSAVIQAQADTKFGTHDEEQQDLRDLVQAYPDSSTLDDYAAMPVEEFGMAMLRGMGKKRRANGEVIQLESTEQKKEPKRGEQGAFLGIGAKPAPGMEGVEIGAWGKADMRKNNKGAGFFTPVMVRDAKTGETITEEELENRKRAVKDREANDRQYRSRERERSPRESQHRSHRHRSRSRSRSRDRKRRHGGGDDDDDDDDDDRRNGYKANFSRRERDRSRDRDRDRRRDKYYERDGRRHRDR